jgi:four helix bundle protein
MEPKEYFKFENLQVYQKAMNFVDMVYQYTVSFPKEELIGLTGQFRRAAVSICLNIAEGAGRTKKEFRRFLDMSKGSVFECVAISEISKRRSYLKENDYAQLKTCLWNCLK